MDNKNIAVLSPRESAKFIVNNSGEKSCNITIGDSAIDRVAHLIYDSLLAGDLSELDFDSCELHPVGANRRAVDWIFFVDSINFSFWTGPDSPKFEVTYKGRKYNGLLAACACVNRAIENGISLTDAHFMANIDRNQLAEIFTSDNGSLIPMLDERLEIVRENGRVLLDKFDGTFFNCVKLSERNAQKLLKIIIENFPNFRDFAEFKGQKISFLKRAQMLVTHVNSCFRGKDPVGEFKDIGFLTMLADYRVPQALAFLGVLKYSPELLRILNDHKLIENGSELEVQFRGFSIFVCDKIVQRLEQLCKENNGNFDSSKIRKLAAVDVDLFLWMYRRKNAEAVEKAVPFHLCRSIFY